MNSSLHGVTNRYRKLSIWVNYPIKAGPCLRIKLVVLKHFHVKDNQNDMYLATILKIFCARDLHTRFCGFEMFLNFNFSPRFL